MLDIDRKPSWIRRAFGAIALTLHTFINSNFLTMVVPTWLQGRPIPGRHDIKKFIEEAYEGNGLCYAATMEIATSMAEAPLCVKVRGSEEVVPYENPLMMLLARPNDFQSMPELIIETVAHMLVAGNCYWVMDDPVFPTFVQTLPPDQVRPAILQGRLWYEFNNWSSPPAWYPAAQILHFREAPDLNDPLGRGLSAIVPIRRFIDIDNVLARYVQDFFSNNAIPPALLIFKNRLTPADQKRVESEMIEKHSTPGNYHKIGISYGDAKLERLGISVKDLDIKPVLDFVETRILQAFNIPPVLIGAQAAMGVSASYSNYREARASFQTENLAPRQKIMAEVLNRGLASKFGDKYCIYFDQTEVMALLEDRQAKRTFALEAWNGGAFTLNQFLRYVGEPEIGAAGEFRKPQSTGGQGSFVAGPKKGNGTSAGNYDPLAGEQAADLAVAS